MIAFTLTTGQMVWQYDLSLSATVIKSFSLRWHKKYVVSARRLRRSVSKSCFYFMHMEWTNPDQTERSLCLHADMMYKSFFTLHRLPIEAMFLAGEWGRWALRAGLSHLAPETLSPPGHLTPRIILPPGSSRPQNGVNKGCQIGNLYRMLNTQLFQFYEDFYYLIV